MRRPGKLRGFDRYGAPILAALGAALAILAGVAAMERAETARYRIKRRSEVSLQLRATVDRLRSALYRKRVLAEALVAYVQAHPDIDGKRFDAVASRLLARRGGVRAIFLIRASGRALAYPAEARAPSLQPKGGAGVWPAVKGPIPVGEDDAVLVGRFPILPGAPSKEATAPRPRVPWGEAVVVIGCDYLWREAGLLRKKANLLMAVRGPDGPGDPGEAVFGDQSLFLQSPARESLSLPGGKWEIAAMPFKGWPKSSPVSLKVHLLGSLVALMAGLIVGYAVRGRVSLHEKVGEANLAKQESEHRYRELVQNANSIILRLDAETRITFFNEFAQRFFGYSEEEVLGRPVVGMIVPETDSSGRDLREMVADVFAHPDQYPVNENENVRRNGERVWVSWANRPIRDAAGEVVEILCVGNDITDRRRAEEALERANEELEARIAARTRELAEANDGLRMEITERAQAETALRESETRYRRLFDDAPVGYHEVSKDGLITRVNRTELTMLGYTEEEMVGKPVWEFVGEREQSRRAFAAKMSGAIPPGQAFERTYVRKDGTPVPVLIEDYLLRDDADDIAGVRSTIQDITERKRLEKQLRMLSLRDELTDLYNRRGFFELAEQQLRVARRAESRLLLLFADLDGLKRINDALGHTAGDRALTETADILIRTFRSSDIIARIGGDEFVVLAADTGPNSEAILVARFKEHIAQLNGKAGRDFELAVSIGVVRYEPDMPASVDELLNKADALMYEAKRKKRKEAGAGAPEADAAAGEPPTAEGGAEPPGEATDDPPGEAAPEEPEG